MYRFSSSVLAVAYDLEVAKVGSSHLKTEPTVKKTTQFYHPKENREKNLQSDSKLPGFFNGDDEENMEGTLSKSESFDQFNFWREPVAEIEDFEEESEVKRSETLPNMASWEVEEDFLEDLNKFLLKRPFLSGFDVTEVDFAVLNLLKEVSLEENLHLNIMRWKQNIQTHDILDCEEVDVERVQMYVRNDDDFTVEDTYCEEIEEVADHGYDSDNENVEVEEDDDDGWITPSNLKSKKAALNGVSDDARPQRVKVALMTTDFAMQNVCKQMGLNIIGSNGMIIRWVDKEFLKFFWKGDEEDTRRFPEILQSPKALAT